MRRRNVILVGFMGTGKSTVGKLLAKRLGWTFIDMDERIEKEQRMPIRELFRIHGESYFRDLETKALSAQLDADQQIVATGGGAVLAEENRSCMLDNGWVIALTANPDTIISRVSRDQNRPLLQGNLQERVNTLLEERKHAYEFAHVTIDTTHLNTDQIVDLILQTNTLEP
ncbi:shikimate kinase [Paenibacillus sp. GP183]|uniref:shikimate kinase n=1 Tax=Paenibacillus sp. GP183 TaxID=1882751 RepID=UPI00089BAF5B|nr:shikimate kinase [Paenibacillus sp. GP183]SEB43623.1 shikimate kinase [Paenibacillus sp. GP183]